MLSAATSASDVSVRVGTSSDRQHAGAIAALINRAYGHGRIYEGDVLRRLAMGDAEASKSANRVLHLAYRGGTLVGCCSLQRLETLV